MFHTKNQPQKNQSNKDSLLRKSVIATAVTIALGGSVEYASGALPLGTRLNFDTGVPFTTGCNFGTINPVTGTCTFMGVPTGSDITDMGGSYFRMDQGNGPADKVSLSMFAPIELGATATSSGQHTGTVDGSENPAIDNPWNFFNNTGMHNLSSGVTVSSDGGTTQLLDFSGWGVNWGEFGPDSPTVPPSPTISMGGTATLVCDVDCSNNDTYTLDMDVHVPVAFASVPYSLHLEGSLTLPGTPPVLNDDNAKTIVGNTVSIDVLANDTVGAEGFDLDSVAVTSGPDNGTTGTLPNGDIDYTPDTGPDFIGMDSFTYTAASTLGIFNDPPDATVDVDVEVNVAPDAVDDPAATNTAALDQGPVVINVLDNDSDVNNANDLPGGIDTGSVTIITPPATGSCNVNPNGTVSYSQAPNPAVVGMFTCTYRISDIDDFNAPLTDTADVNINVTAISSDWPAVLPPNTIPILAYEAGVPNASGDTSDPPQSGSFFTMQVSGDTTIYTTLTAGPSGGLVVDHEQPAFGSHPGAPTGNEQTGFDEAWTFFANTGLTLTKNGGVTGNMDGTLQFGDPDGGQGKYIITWTGIPEIDLGGAPGDFPEDLGFGTIECTDPNTMAREICEQGSDFALDYNAHVPPGDPSGFGGVPYGLNLIGKVQFLDSSLKTSNGTVTNEIRMTAEETGVQDTDVDQQCVGDCIDYTISNVTDPMVSIVIPLAGGVPKNPVYRILEDGAWRTFDSSTGDSIQSAPLGVADTECPDAGDAAYRDEAGLPVTGDLCLQVNISDNGPNDKDPAAGVIVDPAGLAGGGGAGGGVVLKDERQSNNSGCTISYDDISPARRSGWWLLAGLIAWLGWSRRKQARN